MIPVGADEPGLTGRLFIVLPKVEKTSASSPFPRNETLPPFLAEGNCVQIAVRLREQGVPVTWIGVNRQGRPIVESVEIVDSSPQQPLA